MRTVYGFAIVMAKLCTASHVSFINKHLETVSAREREDTMYTIRTMSPQYQAWVSSVGTLVRTPPPTRHLGWRQRHHLWCAACRCERLQRLDALCGMRTTSRCGDGPQAAPRRVSSSRVDRRCA